MLDSLGPYAGSLGGVASVLLLCLTVYQYIRVKKEEGSREQFQRYHEIIRRINVDHLETDKRPYLEVQMASVYELTNLPKYYDVSLRILKRRSISTKSPELREEITRAMAEIEKRKCRWRRK